MTDRPILFSTAMVQALLAGRKTVTRRIIKPRGHASLFNGEWADSCVLDPGNQSWREAAYPWRSGDRLWVRENFSGSHDYDQQGWPPSVWFPNDRIWYWADGNPDDGDWTRPKPSIHMPRFASRLTLAVTSVKVERLQDISEADALAEGVPKVMEGNIGDEIYCQRCQGMGVHGALGANLGYCEVDCDECVTAKHRFSNLWNHINGPGSWEENPWVVAITFTVHKRNIDQIAAPIQHGEEG